MAVSEILVETFSSIGKWTILFFAGFNFYIKKAVWRWPWLLGCTNRTHPNGHWDFKTAGRIWTFFTYFSRIALLKGRPESVLCSAAVCTDIASSPVAIQLTRIDQWSTSAVLLGSLPLLWNSPKCFFGLLHPQNHFCWVSWASQSSAGKVTAFRCGEGHCCLGSTFWVMSWFPCYAVYCVIKRQQQSTVVAF